MLIEICRKATISLGFLNKVRDRINKRPVLSLVNSMKDLVLSVSMKVKETSRHFIITIGRHPEAVVFFLCAASSVGIVFFMFFTMMIEGFPAIANWFLHGFGMRWIPYAGSDTNVPPQFGIIPFIFSTLYVGAGGVLIAAVLGIPCAIYLAEFAHPQVRNTIKTSLEVLTGLPSVVIGLFGFVLIVGVTATYFGAGISVLAGWIVLAIMSLPHIVTISEDAMRAVPDSYREAALGTGATKWQTTIHVVVPAAKSGILTALILALGNAIGETMAVLMVIGGVLTPQITFDPRVGSNVMTALIATEYADIPTPEWWQALFGVGFILFVMVGILNIATKGVLKARS